MSDENGELPKEAADVSQQEQPKEGEPSSDNQVDDNENEARDVTLEAAQHNGDAGSEEKDVAEGDGGGGEDEEGKEEEEEVMNGDAADWVVCPGFEDAGQEPGLCIWRIEKFEPVEQPSKTYGQFYKGDAYIILKTEKTGSYHSWDIHFWLGKHCAQDESGSAAFRTVELDEYLGGTAVQHREVQGHESKKFLSYFKKGIRYLEGGINSGFNKTGDEVHTKRLLRVTGKYTVRVEQVEVKCASLNQGDSFILDDGPHMYVWIGPKSSRIERVKATEMARQIRDDEKAGRAYIHVIEQDWANNHEFFTALGSHDKVIRSAAPDEDDDIVRKEGQPVLLYKIYQLDDGKPGYHEVAAHPLKKDVLESEFCFVLEAGVHGGIFLWTGKECSNDFKKQVWVGVNFFIDTRGFPEWVTVTRIIDGGESPLFKQYFSDWQDTAVPTPDMPDSNIAEQSYEGVDGSELHQTQAPRTEDFLPDDASGAVKVWRVNNFELVPVSEEAQGVFFGGDSYVIQYDSETESGDTHIIYFWQGLFSPPEDQGSAALHAMRLDDEMGGIAVQIRVVMNKEPAHFLKIFNGKIVIFMAGKSVGFHSIHDREGWDPTEVLLFHIRALDEDNVKAYQVVARGASLNSNDVFLVVSPKRQFIWNGKHCEELEVEMAKLMAQYLSPQRGEPVELQEGSESLQFWNDLGGEEAYYTGARKQASVKVPPRLFHCSNSSGKFVVEEVPSFDQEDLVEGDVMILDTNDEIFIWVGKGANEFEKKEAYKTAYTYINSDPSGRNTDNTLIIVVRQGFEPPQFTGHFVPWDADKWNQGKTFQELLEEVGRENAGINFLEDEVEKYFATYSFEDLQRSVPPEGVDVTKKESYLSEEDFARLFNMEKDAFYKLPEWRRINMKKDAALF